MNKNNEVWEKIFNDQEWGKYPSVPVIQFVARNFYSEKIRGDIKILEIGCGPGGNLWYMAREGFQVFGIDFSETACKRAKDRLIEENLTKNLGGIFVGDYEEVLRNFNDNFFDAIIDVESLYCNSFEKSKFIIDLCYRKLKAGGKLFSQTFSERHWGLMGIEESGYHAGYPTDGGLADKGFARYTTREDIAHLYGTPSSNIEKIELQELYLENGNVKSEWLIYVEKL